MTDAAEPARRRGSRRSSRPRSPPRPPPAAAPPPPPARPPPPPTSDRSSPSAPPSPAASSSPCSSSALPADDLRQPSLAEAVTQVSERVSLLVSEEIELAKAEIAVKTRKLATGAVVGIVAGVFFAHRPASSCSTRPPGAPT